MTSNGGEDRGQGSQPAAGAGGDASGGPTWSQLVSSGHLEYDRVVFFSDAIFAIAITLLAVEIPVPASAGVSAASALAEAVPRITAFGVSFAVIGLFWLGHHLVFRHIDAFNRRLMILNLLFLGTIAFLPYPTELLSLKGDEVAAVVFYAAWVALAGAAELAIWLYASRVPGLLTAGISPWLRRYYALRMLRVPVVFLLSIPVAVAAPAIAPYTWLLVLVISAVMHRTLGAGPGGQVS